MADPKFNIAITGDSSKFRQELAKSVTAAKKAGDDIAKPFKDFKSLVGGLGVGFAVSQLIGALTTVTEKAIDSERSFNQLQATLKATGYAAGLTADQIEEIGKGVQGRSVFDDDDIRKASTALLRFREISGETFKQLINLAPDVATALGKTLPDAVTMLGKAIIDPARGLRAFKEAGVNLSEAQIDLAARFRETGDAASAAKVGIDAITGSVGGAAESDTTGAYGASKRLARSWDDLLKTLGKPMLRSGGAMDSFGEFLGRLERHIEKVHQGKADLDGILQVLGLIDEKFALRGPEKDITDQLVAQAEKRAATVGKLVSEGQQARDHEYEQQKKHLKNMADSAAAFGSGELQLQRATLDAQQQALETAYARGEIAAENYYEELKRLRAQNLAAVRADLNRQIEAQLDIVDARNPLDSSQPMFSQEERDAAFRKATELINKVTAARQAFSLQNQRALENERADIEKLGDEYGQLAERIALAAGKSGEAAAIATERATRLFRRQLTARGDTATRDQLDAENRRVVQLAELSDATRKYQDDVERLGIAQARVDTQAATGTQSEIDLLNQKAAIAQKYIPLLEAQIAAQKRLADALPAGPEQDAALLRLEQARVLVEQLTVAADGLKNKFSNIFSDNLTTAFEDIITGSKSASDAFRDFTKSIARDITHLASQQIAKQLANAIFGGASGSTAGAGLGGFLASLFGGGGAATGSGLTGGWLAGGTDFARGGPTMVGERGPEIVNLPRGAQVIPYHELSRQRAERQNTTNININVPGGTSHASADQIALAVGREVRRTMARNG
jgi:hypothetical protein